MTTTSVECLSCGNPLTVYNNTFIDFECQRAYTRDEYEALEESWALYQHEAAKEWNEAHRVAWEGIH